VGEDHDDVIHARADLDEAAYHIHAIVMPRATVEMTRTPRKSGKETGERRKQAFREAVVRREEPPEKRQHVRPRDDR
jgi:hypothetical protein